MSRHFVLKTIIGLLLAITLSACSSSSNNNKRSTTNSLRHVKSGNQLDLSKIPEFTGSGGEGIYICIKKAECPELQLGIYQVKPASPTNQASFAKLDHEDPKTI